MGNIINLQNSQVDQSRRVWPIRYFNQVNTPSDMEASRFSLWDPKRYMEEFKYPAKEPAKDF
jgi:hypothetical protein